MDDPKKIRSFTDLVAWQESHKLVLHIYQVTEKFPVSERYGLTSQMRRAAVSISSNIAEGFSRRSPKEKEYFYSMSHGSLTEIQNQLFIARDVSYVSSGKFNEIWDQTIVVHKLITGLIKSVRRFNHRT